LWVDLLPVKHYLRWVCISLHHLMKINSSVLTKFSNAKRQALTFTCYLRRP
jgi:hypothetical protein